MKKASLLKYIVLAGNIVYILWILRNAITERSPALGRVEIVTFIGLIILLGANSYFLTRK